MIVWILVYYLTIYRTFKCLTSFLTNELQEKINTYQFIRLSKIKNKLCCNYFENRDFIKKMKTLARMPFYENRSHKC